MFSAARRSLLAGTSSTATVLDRHHRLAATFVSHSAQPARQQPFSTTPSAGYPARHRLSKEEWLERKEKLEKRQKIRELRKERQVHKEFVHAEVAMKRRQEVEQKKEVGEEIVRTVAPLSPDELEAVYKGLMLAPPEDLAPLLIEPSNIPALPDPAVESRIRRDRVEQIVERLQNFEAELVEERKQLAEPEEEGEPRPSLAARLRGARTEDAGKLALAKAQPALLMVPSTARTLIDFLETITPEDEPVALPRDGPKELTELPRGLLSRAEWSDLVLASALDGDREGVLKALQLMNRTTPISEGKVVEDALAIYAAQGQPQEALALAKFARENNLPISLIAHHQLLTSLLPSHPEFALRHLEAMEAAGYTPLRETYTAVTKRLILSSNPNLVREGWDLYSHSRLVAYPIPDVPMFSTMIQACSRGEHPAPERAIDLFTEMTDNGLPPSELAYNGVIRACARDGTRDYYHEALRFMRRMLDDNVKPSRHTFHAVLEGAKKHGDLARARWMLIKMVGVGGDVAPNEATLALVLQAYAWYRPAGKDQQKGKAAQPPQATHDAKPGAADTGAVEGVVEADGEMRPEDDPANLSAAPTPSTGSASAAEIVELLGEESLFYPGPLPRSSAETLAEARKLMLQVVDATVLDAMAPTPPASTEDRPPSTMFPLVEPSSFLLNSYFTVLARHASFAAASDFFAAAFDRAGVPKSRYSYQLMMKRIELLENDEQAVEAVKKLWEEWLRWTETPLPPFSPGSYEGENVETTRVMRLREEEQWAKERRNGENVRLMWAGLIRVLARAYRVDEALSVLKRFFQTFSPYAVREPMTPAQQQPDDTLPLPLTRNPHLPNVPIRISSHQYPETAPSFDRHRPPYLKFHDLRVLHQRCVELENKKGLALVKAVAAAYEGSLWRVRKKELEAQRDLD
ncbi:pentatricopeptide repeat protein [Rhodotorula toruloides]|uniref:Pentatricopeptide repeat protein n=1 Tax=Rhodotorula toruloides TaxID=5286 RepID=A0A511KB94_RHOTO|nr:pentatricopeptide repeat protein [Rhodotorula toruloides]